jgi:hypothetical protein
MSCLKAYSYILQFFALSDPYLRFECMVLSTTLGFGRFRLGMRGGSCGVAHHGFDALGVFLELGGNPLPLALHLDSLALG